MIIADDLSGANDTAVHFAQRGIATKVSVGFTQRRGKEWNCSALAINTNSRHDAPVTAAEKVQKALSLGRDFGFTHVYKKSDSALRGNVGAELETVLQKTGLDRLHFVPAYPALGRFTRNGMQYVGDKLLHQSEFARDPLNPMTTSSVKEIIQKQSNVPVWLCQSGNDWNNFKGIVVHDATSTKDLEILSTYLGECKELWLSAGPGGFASFLPDHLDFGKPTLPNRIQFGKSLFVVNGSASQVALSQVKYGLESGLEGLKVSPEDLRMGNLPDRREANSILFSAVESAELDSYSLSSDAFNLKFSEIAAAVWRERSSSTLCVIGGDTLFAILKVLRVTVIRPVCEIMPGLVLAGFEHQGKERKLISKAGSFGEENILDQIIKLTQE